MDFTEAVSYLLSLGHETLAIKLGLDNIKLLLDELHNPQNAYRAVQIAGTNGKGSTAAMLDSICNQAGIKTGLFTSPHLSSITERVRIAGRDITKEDFAVCATDVRAAAEKLQAEARIGAAPSFFEQVTAIALLAFKRTETELAILETGLGGRLDATTAARAEIVAITPIAMDHEKYLGDSIESIAAEKAAIIQPGVKAIIASQSPAVSEVIARQSEASGVVPKIDPVKARIHALSDTGQAIVTFTTKENVYPTVRLSLRGRHQVINASVAVGLAEELQDKGFPITKRSIVAGLESTRHHGRLELFPGRPSFLLDGAHNPEGAVSLRNFLLESVVGPITLVFGAMVDKRLNEMASILFPVAEQLIITRPDNDRAASLELLRELAVAILPPARVRISPRVEDALTLAREITRRDGTVCVAGSLYLVGAIRSKLEIEAGGK
jgi:dihydrofolate synthase/folylpolyglutamate synthase